MHHMFCRARTTSVPSACFSCFQICCIITGECECLHVRVRMNVLAFAQYKCRKFSYGPTSHLCPIPRIPRMAKSWIKTGLVQYKGITFAKTVYKTHTHFCKVTCNIGHSERLLALCSFGAVGVTLFGPPWC